MNFILVMPLTTALELKGAASSRGKVTGEVTNELADNPTIPP